MEQLKSGLQDTVQTGKYPGTLKQLSIRCLP